MKKALLGLAVVSAVAFAAWNTRSDEVVEQADPNYVVDRIWIDHIPKGERDVIQVFVAITEQPFGVFQAASQWKGAFELFRYESHGNEIRIHYGQTGERETVKTRATKCNEKSFDYCLELDGASRGVKKYYSMKGWEIDGVASVEEIRAHIESLVNAK